MLRPEIAKNSLKPLSFGIQGRAMSSILVSSESSSAALFNLETLIVRAIYCRLYLKLFMCVMFDVSFVVRWRSMLRYFFDC